MTQGYTLIDVTIEGYKPLLMCRFGERAEISVSAGSRPVTKGHRSPREEALEKAYRDSETGALYMPVMNLFSCIVSAGRYQKLGRNKLTTQKSSLVPGYVSIMDPLVLPFGTTHFEVDSRRVVIPATGGSIMRHRPRIDPPWRLSFTLRVNSDEMPLEVAYKLIEDAGHKIGLGDFRPERKGPFGQFAIVKWEVQDEEVKAAA